MKKFTSIVAFLALAALAQAQNFTATLNGAAERPTPSASAGTGIGTLTLTGTTVSYDVTYSGLSGTPTAAHIHGPAAASATAGVIQAITANGVLGSSGRYTGTMTVTSDQATSISAGLTYFNIHTAASPGGEIRGQITLVPEPATWALLGLGAAGMVASRRRKA